MFTRTFVAMAALTGAASSLANPAVVVSLYTTDGSQGNYAQTDNIPTNSNTTLYHGATDSAAGSLATATMSAHAMAPVTSQLLSSNAQVALIETVTFSSNATGIGYLDFGWSAALAPQPTDASVFSSGEIALYVVPTAESAFQHIYQLSNQPCGIYPITTCTTGTSINSTGTLAFTLHPGPASIEVALAAYTTQIGGFADLSGSAYLRLPKGVTFTSESGVFMLAAVDPVPEPDQYILMAAGLCSLALVGRRRNQRR